MSLDISNYEQEYMENKAWGWKYNAFSSVFCSTDLIFVKKGGYCSWHIHDYKYNRFVVLQGVLEVTIEFEHNKQKTTFPLGEGCEMRKLDVRPGSFHQFKALTDVLAIEIESVRCLKDDIHRETTGGIK